MFRKYCERLFSSSTSGNNLVSDYVHNRNPRNLEKLCIAHKPTGWHLERKGRCYWHKLVFKRCGKHLTASIIHHTGPTVVFVTTKEWSIRKHLYSTIDQSAYINLGRILALRCIQCGITEVSNGVEPNENSHNLKAFLKHVEEGGITLEEPEQYKNPRPSDIERPEKPWEAVV